MSDCVLVVAAHADDEVLGCGGTIAKHAAEGTPVHLLLMADGVTSRTTCCENDLRLRNDATELAAQYLGISTINRCGFPDNRMDEVPLLLLAQQVEEAIQRITPTIVYTHHHGDLNIDHRRTQQAVLTACRPQPGFSVTRILGFEVLSSTEWSTPTKDHFCPSMFVDITEFLGQKLKAINAYKQEMRNPPHSRSVEHIEILAKHRGFCVGRLAAEAFEVYRIVE